MNERAMTTAPAAAGPLADAALRAIEGDQPAWLRERRRTAWEGFLRLPLPSQVYQEEWRRTEIGDLDLEALGLPRRDNLAGTGDEVPAMWSIGPDRAGLLTHANGSTTERALAAEAARAGVLFMDLAEAARTHGDLVRAHLGTVLGDDVDRHKFRALNAALWSAGTFVYVPKDVEVALPLVAQAWLGAAGGALFPRTLLIAEAASKVTLIDLYGSAAGGDRAYACGVTEAILRQGAQVRYVALQEWGAPMREAGSLIRAWLERDATLNSLVVALGGSLVKTDVESILSGPGGTSEMLGLYFGEDRQHVDIHTLQEHRAPHTLSDLLYKGAVTADARAVFAGLIRVHQGAQKTNAFQANRNLILSERARSDSIPKLEIMANDLRCTHGSATSRLNEEHIFYLMSRGLSRAQATHMIVEGFFGDVLDRIPLERVREHLGTKISEKMD